MLLKSFSGTSQMSLRNFSKSNPLNRIENLFIIGSGLMGSGMFSSFCLFTIFIFKFSHCVFVCFTKTGIAQSAAASGKFKNIQLQDISKEQLDKAHKKIGQNLTRMKEQKRVEIDNVEEVVARIQTTTEFTPKDDSNLLVIEAIPELIEPKQQLFKKLNDTFKNNSSVILATNTSSLPCHEIGKFVETKQRFAGLHFFNPVPLMKLVEIISTMETSQETYNNLDGFVKDIGKVGVACKDTPGFIVNRLLVPYMFEAVQMLERGDATARDIDVAMKLGAGYPMGPFELADFVGLDTLKFIADSWSARGDPGLKPAKSKILDKMISKGHFGKKSGRGFYDYSSGKKA